MVSRALRNDATAPGGGQLLDGQQCPPDLERSAALEILGFEPEARAGECVQVLRANDRGSPYPTGQSSLRAVDIAAVESYTIFFRCGEGSCLLRPCFPHGGSFGYGQAPQTLCARGAHGRPEARREGLKKGLKKDMDTDMDAAPKA
ncbi:hypothetical protein GCM10010433_73430 [Streptomyces pulveraceus]